MDKAGAVHSNCGKLLSTTIPPDKKNLIISTYINDFSDANFSHFCEIVKEDLKP